MKKRKRAKHTNLLDHLDSDVVATWIRDDVVDAARAVVASGRISRPSIGQTWVRAVVADPEQGRVRVGITWDDGPVSKCECDDWRDPCRHSAALVLLLTGDAMPGGDESDEEDHDDGDDSDGEAAPRSPAEVERARRRERGGTDLFTVRPHPGTRIFGGYQVLSPSTRAYDVSLRSLDAPENGCECPDFDTNLLGTCKHIEAVIHHLRRDAPRRLARAASEGTTGSYLFLAFDPSPEIRLRVGARATPAGATRFFSRDGRPLSSVEEGWRQVEAWARDHEVAVPREVERFAARVLEAAERVRRQHAIEAEVRAAGREQPGFRATLYAYQVEGVAFLASRGRALLADEMGLGKTAQAIAAMVRLARVEGARRTVIVSPTSLKHQWQREIERFTGLGDESIQIVGGPRETRREQYRAGRAILITSYELARADEREIAELAPDLLILDEAQRIRNWRTQTAAAVKRIPSRFVFVLTGTPLENRLDDLYSLMQVIDPHLLGPLWRFNEDFSRLDERGKVVAFKNLDRLRDRLAPVLLRRRKEQVLTELPARIVNRLEVPLTEEQRAIHDDAEQNVGRLLAILRRRPLSPIEEQRLMRAFQRARMSCDAAALVDDAAKGGAPKIDELESVLDEVCVQGGRKVVVFSEWERMQELAAGVCDKLGIGHVRLHGGVPSAARGRLIDRFREDLKCKAFLSTDAGGVGLNLQVASHVINLDLPWNPAVLAQRIGRVHRLGQREPVNVVLLVSKQSMEERIEATLDGKRALFAAAVGDDAETTELARASMASRIATLLGGSFAADTGKAVLAPPPPVADPLVELRERIGDALERVVRLPDGRLLGVVRGEVPAQAAGGATALLLSSRAASALVPLGALSPLAQGEEVYRAAGLVAPAADDPIAAARRDLLAGAERKLAAARTLIAAGMASEALGLLRDAMSLAVRSLDERADPGEGTAALLGAVYGHLVPSGALSVAAAGALARAGELARAFGGSPIAVPPALVEEVEGEARDLLARSRERLASPVAAAAS